MKLDEESSSKKRDMGEAIKNQEVLMQESLQNLKDFVGHLQDDELKIDQRQTQMEDQKQGMKSAIKSLSATVVSIGRKLQESKGQTILNLLTVQQ